MSILVLCHRTKWRRGESTLWVTLDKRLLHRKTPVSTSDAGHRVTQKVHERTPADKEFGRSSRRSSRNSARTSYSMELGCGRLVIGNAQAVRDDWDGGTCPCPRGGFPCQASPLRSSCKAASHRSLMFTCYAARHETACRSCGGFTGLSRFQFPRRA